MNSSAMAATVSPNVGGKDGLREFAVTVRQLSNANISLNVSQDVDTELQAYRELLLSLKLPGRRQNYAIACIVHNRFELNGEFIYGCEYDWSSTMDPLGVAEDLLEYTLDA